MIDMHKGGRRTLWRYVRVSWPDMGETGEIPGVITHRISESMFTTSKVSGSLTYVDMPDLGDDLVRIYCRVSLGDATEEFCSGTFRAATGKETVSEGVTSGTANLHSMISVLETVRFEETFCVPAGTNIIDAATRLIEECNLTAIATPCGKTAAQDASWSAGTPYIEAVNDMMEMIGYLSAGVNAFGHVTLEPYADPSSKAPADVFSDTSDDVSDASFVREFNRFDVPNVVVVVSASDDGEAVRAVAENADPENGYSTVARRLRIAEIHEYGGLTQSEAEAKADELLKSAMTRIETITMGHAGKRFDVGDAVQMDYRRSSTVGKYTASKRTTKGTSDMDSETSMRRTVKLYG